MHILVVEDERKGASFIKRGLEAAHYSVDIEHDGAAGLSRLLKSDYDLIILDVMLPRLDGLSLMRKPVVGRSRCRFFCSSRGPQ